MTTEPNDILTRAIDTELNSNNSGTFSTNGSIGDNSNVNPGLDIDLYQIDLNAGTLLEVDINTDTSVSPLDSGLRLFDSQGNQLVFSDDTPAPGENYSLESYIEFVASNPGTYYIGVSGFSNFSYDPSREGSGIEGNIGDYEISITLTNPNEVNGTPDNDILNGTNEIDLIYGLTGDDLISSFAGNDSIIGGQGNDLIDAGIGDDTVESSEGDDQIFGREGNDSLWANEGLDVVFGGEGLDTIGGASGSDRIFGNEGNDDLNGGEDNDILQGGEGFDTILGGNGDDSLVGSSGYDSLDGGNGNDNLIGVDLSGVQFGSFEVDTLTGGEDEDVFILGDVNRVYYDDGESSTTGELDYALITDYNTTEDSLQLHSSSDFYSIDLFNTSVGTTNAAIIYDSSNTDRAEVIGILENVAPDLTFANLTINFV